MATIPVGEIVLWRVVSPAVADAALADNNVNLATPATWTGTGNHAFYQEDSMHIGVVAEVHNPGTPGENCHVIFGLCAGNTLALRAAAATLILAGGAAAAANRAIVTNIPVFGGSRKKRQSKKRRNNNKQNHKNNQ